MVIGDLLYVIPAPAIVFDAEHLSDCMSFFVSSAENAHRHQAKFAQARVGYILERHGSGGESLLGSRSRAKLARVRGKQGSTQLHHLGGAAADLKWRAGPGKQGQAAILPATLLALFTLYKR